MSSRGLQLCLQGGVGPGKGILTNEPWLGREGKGRGFQAEETAGADTQGREMDFSIPSSEPHNSIHPSVMRMKGNELLQQVTCGHFPPHLLRRSDTWPRQAGLGGRGGGRGGCGQAHVRPREGEVGPRWRRGQSRGRGRGAGNGDQGRSSQRPRRRGGCRSPAARELQACGQSLTALPASVSGAWGPRSASGPR